MSTQSKPPAQTPPGRRRQPPRRAPAIIEQRQPKPFMFGRGGNLTKGEREAVKERIALIGGLALVVVLAALLGWGWYQDNVSAPAAARAAANKPIAQVGNYVIRSGYFQRYEQFEQARLNQTLQQVQQQLSALQANPKQNASQISQLQAEQSQLQQQQGSIPSDALKALIDLNTVLQRAYTVGISVSTAEVNKELHKMSSQAGGPLHLQQSIEQDGLHMDEFRTLVKAQLLQNKVQAKLAKSTPRAQLEVRASHILLPAAKRAEAVTLLKEVENRGNFAALARKYSTDTASAKKGGDLGFFKHGDMVGPFDKAAFSMKVGQVRLVQSQYGWHIIKVTGRQKMLLTKTQYQQAQGNAYSAWLQKQQGEITIRHYAAPPPVPGSTPTSVLSQPSVPQPAPQQPQQQVPSQNKVVPPPQPSKGGAKVSSGTSSTKSSSSSSGSSRKK